MKVKFVAFLFAAVMLPLFPQGPPASDAQIVKYEALDGGPLQVAYSDAAIVKIPKERGRFAAANGPVTQETFKSVQIASDRQHIGWLADYMMCAQSYPCSMELVIFRAGNNLRHVSPEVGIVWEWNFLADGNQIVLHSGFPHGDDKGVYTLWDSDGGPVRGRYVPGEGPAPTWVQQLK